MLDKSTNGREPGEIASGADGCEKSETHAGKPHASHRIGRGLLRTAWWEGLPRKEIAAIPMRIKSTLAARRKSSTSQDYPFKLTVEDLDQALLFIGIVVVLFITASLSFAAPPDGDHPPPLSARELVQDVVHNEESARQNPRNHYKFVRREITPTGTETSIQIESSQGEIGEVVSVNGEPPSKKRCQADNNSLRKLVTDPQSQRRQERDQKEQMGRIEKLMAAVPEAFIFQYHGKEQGTEWTEISFRPNPRFQPQSHEASVLKGMRGTLWVDPASHRLVKIDGTLFKDVQFGWGFLASLDRGGHFVMRQSKLPGGNWKQTSLEVDLDGSKLVFGQLHVHFRDSSYSFVRLAEPPTLAEAVNMIEHTPTACRKSQDTRTTAQVGIR